MHVSKQNYWYIHEGINKTKYTFTMIEKYKEVLIYTTLYCLMVGV